MTEAATKQNYNDGDDLSLMKLTFSFQLTFVFFGINTKKTENQTQ